MLALLPELWPTLVLHAAMIALTLARPQLAGAATPLFLIGNAAVITRAVRLRARELRAEVA